MINLIKRIHQKFPNLTTDELIEIVECMGETEPTNLQPNLQPNLIDIYKPYQGLGTNPWPWQQVYYTTV